MNPERRPQVGSVVVDGIAIGRASVWARDPVPPCVSGTAEEEHGRLVRSHLRATRGVEALVRRLPLAEADLFVPELAILAELGPLLLERVDGGASAEEAIHRATAPVSTDLLLDARARLLDGLGRDSRSVDALLEGRDGDRVLITESLMPSVVASLPPRVVGIVAASDGAAPIGAEDTSHAVVIARGRGIPLAFVPLNAVSAIADDDTVVLDTTGSVALMWVSPAESIVADARLRHDRLVIGCAQEEASLATIPLAHLVLDVGVSIGSVYECIPAAAEGIGLLRTELVFSGHATAPSEIEQLATLCAIGAPVGSGSMVVRLFDAGGDKPLTWLQAVPSAPLARGIELLFMHSGVLDTQLRAIVRAAEHVNVRILLPLVRCAGDVDRIRALSHGKVAVGAMVETAAAVDQIEEIASAADFICIGTNDLFANVTGQSRAHSTLSFDTRALRMIERVVAVAHAHARKVSVCGELAADRRGARVLAGLGADAISVSTARFAKTKLSLRDVTLGDCRQAARDALQ
jgi:multiphosphoryl transfer protein